MEGDFKMSKGGSGNNQGIFESVEAVIVVEVDSFLKFSIMIFSSHHYNTCSVLLINFPNLLM